MKFLKILSLVIFTAFISCILNACGSGKADELKAKLTFTSGVVESQNAASPEWKPVSLNAELAMSDTVKTGPKSNAKIDFSDGVKIFIEENTSVKLKEIKKPVEKGTLDIIVEIISGAIFFDVTKRENSKFEMETSTAVAGVKGTRGIVSFKDNKTKVLVTEGVVEVSAKKDAADKVTLNPDDAVEFGDITKIPEKSKIDFSKEKFADTPLLKTLSADDLVKKIDVIRSR